MKTQCGYPLEYIQWHDHTSFSVSAWRPIDEYQEREELPVVESVGFVIHETDKLLTLVHSVAPFGPTEDAGAGDMTIGKELIVKRRRLKPGK